MSVSIVTSAEPILTLAEVRRQFAIGPNDTCDDLLLEDLARAAQWTIEPPSWLGQAFGLQTWDLFLDVFPCEGIKLPFGPLVSIDSVKYVDAASVLTTISSINYVVDTALGWIVPVSTFSWPTPLDRINAVAVRFTAGYAADDPQLMPVKQAILLAMGQMKSMAREDLLLTRENVPGVGTQEWALSTDAISIIQKTIDRLLIKYWVPFL